MASNGFQNPAESQVLENAPLVSRRPRLWFPITLVGLYWALSIIVGQLEKLYFFGFLYGMASAAVLILVYFCWWWLNGRIRLSDRFFGFVLILGVGAIVEPFCHASIGWFALWTMGLPIVLTVWTLWLVLSKKIGVSRFRPASIAIVALTWASFALIRFEGANADLKADLRWRWTPSSEDLFLAEKARAAEGGSEISATSLANWVSALTPGDWTGFRGPDREGVIRGVSIATDWKNHPPQLLWRQRIGPAWSSVIVIGDRLFTQEQRGEMESVVCYEAATGKELWVHNDRARFWEAVSGAGPRATPTFSDGNIYTLGGTGLLNCLDAGTGQLCWSHDIRAEAEAKVPMWGYSSSPLVVDGRLIAFAGGEASLRAYQASSGDLAWTAEAGPGTYASPQLATLAGQAQILILSESGLSAFDPSNGAKLWQLGQAMQGAPRTLQPHLIGSHQLVIGQLQAFGVSLIDVMRDANDWKVEELWHSTQMKPEFPDFVVHGGHAYGFDGAIFACLDLSAGNRAWKGGRYGRGQVVLLEDQKILLVISEAGEAILLEANPHEQHELGKFQALSGKTWNHPVLTNGRLYVRNAEEMACYELPLKGGE